MGTILGYLKGMRTIILTVLAGLIAGCVTAPAYWSRPGATLPQLADESTACYRASLDEDSPSALPGPGSSVRLLPRSEPPPKLWARAPRQVALEHFDEQLRYERCMHQRGWVAVGSGLIPRR
jgi:hypothetical protein